jgi:hypothetical protein
MKPIPQGANEVIGAAVDGRLYVYGGERMQTQHVYGGVNLKTQPLGIFWSYDPKADTWNQLKANPVPSTTRLRSGSARNSMCSAVSASPIQEGSAGIPKTRFGFYDSETQSWSALPPMPTLRGALAAVGEDSRRHGAFGRSDRRRASRGCWHDGGVRSIDQLTAGLEQMTHEIAKLQAVEKYVLYKNSEPPPRSGQRFGT